MVKNENVLKTFMIQWKGNRMLADIKKAGPVFFGGAYMRLFI